MSAANQSSTAHSAIVHMHLRVNAHILAISQLGPDFVLLQAPIDHPSAEAEVSLSIDGYEDRWMVHLPDGIHSGRARTAITSCANSSGRGPRPPIGASP